MSEKTSINKNAFNELIMSDTSRNLFFKRAYHYIHPFENVSIFDASKGGLFEFIGNVRQNDSDHFDCVFKVCDYLSTLVYGYDGSEPLPMSAIKEYDKLVQNEIEFLLKVQGKEFEDVEYRKVLWVDKQDQLEGAENIIEIKGYGKIPQEELIRQYADKGEVVSTEGFQVPFRFFEMPYLNTIDNKLYCLMEALSLGADISNALCCVHNKKLFNVACHGNIKIANILYENTNDKYDPYRYILTDFNTVHYDMECTRAASKIGTPSIMAPEMFRGKNNEYQFYSYEVDYYSLAATMYCMLNSGIYPKPNGEIRLVKGDKKPYSYPGFDTDCISTYPPIYVDPREASSQNRVIEMLTRNGFGEREATVAAEVYLFIVKQLEFEMKDRIVHREGDESPVECTRRLKNTYLTFLFQLGEACFDDKNYKKAEEYLGRYLSRQKRELYYCQNQGRKRNAEVIQREIRGAKYMMALCQDKH